jgi:hypothetical protein
MTVISDSGDADAVLRDTGGKSGRTGSMSVIICFGRRIAIAVYGIVSGFDVRCKIGLILVI